MKSVEFCYWLQGFFELSGGVKPLTEEQTKCIQAHLALVFKHEIDPSYPNNAALSAIHSAIDQPGHHSLHDELIRC